MAPEKTDPESEPAVNTSTVSEDGVGASSDGEHAEHVEHDPYFEPVVTLPEIKVFTNEEDEEEMARLRCKLFRYNTTETPAEWKERGTGDVKILKHIKKKTIRVLMRQDKTLKIRANHYITPFMELKPNCGSDRAWVWSVPADFADEEPKQELFAVRFANSENARLFKEKFDEARGIVTVTEVKTSVDGGGETSSSSTSTSLAATPSKDGENNATEKATEAVVKDMEKMTVKAGDDESTE